MFLDGSTSSSPAVASLYAVYTRNPPSMYSTHSKRCIASIPMTMNMPRATRAPMIPNSNARDRYWSGSPKYPKMTRNTKRLSTLSARSATYAVT